MKHSISRSDSFDIVARLNNLPFPARLGAFIALGTLVLSGSLIALKEVDTHFFTSIPRHGGELTEGVIGRPHLINPLQAKNDADKDLSALIYSGLFRPSTSGSGYEPDLASSMNVSEDGKTYTVTLKDDISFHDGKPVTADDVLFTVERIQDKSFHSPIATSLYGATTTVQGPRTVIFTLAAPHATFPSALTFGVLPKHIWEHIGTQDDDTEFNLRPIGSGPYAFTSLKRDPKTELITSYDLTAFKHYAHGEPYITNLHLNFYGNETDLVKALTSNEIDSAPGISPEDAAGLVKKGNVITAATMPRIFGVYFNTQKSVVLADPAVRKALDLSLARDTIVKEAYGGFAAKESYAFPGLIADDSQGDSMGALAAITLLEKEGWTRAGTGIWTKSGKQPTTLSFTLSVPDVSDVRAAAEATIGAWKTMGIDVKEEIVSMDALHDKVLAPRAFEALFTGEVTGRDVDPEPYWKSTEKTKGANLAQYDSKSTDALIDSLAKTTNENARNAVLTQIALAIRVDRPAIFAYSPEFLYAGKSDIKRKLPASVSVASERFAGIENWYVEMERVWNFLSHKSSR